MGRSHCRGGGGFYCLVEEVNRGIRPSHLHEDIKMDVIGHEYSTPLEG